MVNQSLDNSHQKSEEKGLEVFIVYVEEDKSFYAELEKQLTPMLWENLIKLWHPGEILPGQEWSREIQAHLDTADIILLLLSASFIKNSREEMARAVRRHRSGNARLIPVILRPCDWRHLPLNSIKCLPKKN